MSVAIRLELAAPGVQVLQGDHQLFNVIITAHAFIMSAPSNPIEDCGKTPQVVYFCVVGKSEKLLHIASLSDRAVSHNKRFEPNKAT